jgi:hypothetical protein
MSHEIFGEVFIFSPSPLFDNEVDAIIAYVRAEGFVKQRFLFARQYCAA